LSSAEIAVKSGDIAVDRALKTVNDESTVCTPDGVVAINCVESLITVHERLRPVDDNCLRHRHSALPSSIVLQQVVLMNTPRLARR